jgi:hypothetical protein
LFGEQERSGAGNLQHPKAGDIAERDRAAVAHRLRFRCPIVLLTQAFGGGNGSTGGAAGGSSLASADFSGCNRGASGKRSGAII